VGLALLTALSFLAAASSAYFAAIILMAAAAALARSISFDLRQAQGALARAADLWAKTVIKT
jgi:hypothetical protein